MYCTFQILYDCCHLHTFATPNLRTEDAFLELARECSAVLIGDVCPHCHESNHPDLSKRYTYIRRTLNPCRGTEYHRLDCGHYVRSSEFLSCVDNCELGYRWMPHVSGSFGCQDCIFTYFRALAESEVEKLLLRIGSPVVPQGWDQLSNAEFSLFVSGVVDPEHLNPLQESLSQFLAAVFESMLLCGPVDLEEVYQEIDMDSAMADMNIGETEIEEAEQMPEAQTNRRGATSEGANQDMEDLHGRITRNHQREEARSEHAHLVQAMEDLDMRDKNVATCQINEASSKAG